MSTETAGQLTLADVHRIDAMAWTHAIVSVIMPLQRKTAKTPRRYLTGICVFPSQRHLRHLQNQPPAHKGGLSWVGERSSSTIPASRSMKSRRLRAAYSRTFSLSMRVKKDNESLQNGSGSGSTKTIKTAAATRLPNDSKARNKGSGYQYSQYAGRDGTRRPFLRIFSYPKVCNPSHS